MPIIEHSPINEHHDFFNFLFNCINNNEVAQT
jgi:hypothetical protein